MAEAVLVSLKNSIATVTLNRPEMHNAFNEDVIAALTETFRGFNKDPGISTVVLRGNGKSFCAGGDLNWMRKTSDYSYLQNVEDAMKLAELMKLINRLHKPVIAVVHGAAYGGGVGLAAISDIAIAAEEAKFCLSEVKIGLIPSVIGPYVMAKIGESAARRYFLTAEVFSAQVARNLGLVHEVVPAAKLEEKLSEILAALKQGAPGAQGAAKALIHAVAHKPVDGDVIRDTAERIAESRASEEGKEGLSAFLNKTEPSWRTT